jgi:ribosomal-protein-alanine N-acetyltransferase
MAIPVLVENLTYRFLFRHGLKLTALAMTPAMLPDILAIEEDSFEWPWSLKDFKQTLRKNNCTGVVIKDSSDSIIGYAVVEAISKNSPALKVLNLAVRADYRRKGVGSRLMLSVLRSLNEKYSRVLAEVRDGNLSAHLFLKSFGFKAVDVLHKRYEESSDDMYVFQFNRTGQPEQPAKVTVKETSQSRD